MTREREGSRPTNLFAPPRARLSETDPAPLRRWSIAAVALAVLAGLWWLDVPRHQVSGLVGYFMPYPDHPTSLVKGSTLFVERLLIESLVCIPAAALLAWVLPARLTLAAGALALEQWIRSAPDVLHAPSQPRLAAAWMALVLHSMLLIGVTAWIAAKRRRTTH